MNILCVPIVVNSQHMIHSHFEGTTQFTHKKDIAAKLPSVTQPNASSSSSPIRYVYCK